jgi:hypothetical protein
MRLEGAKGWYFECQWTLKQFLIYMPIPEEMISFWLYKENKLRDWKSVYSAYSPWAPHTNDFVVLTSLSHSRKIILFVLQIGKQEIGKAKDLSAPLRVMRGLYNAVSIVERLCTHIPAVLARLISALTYVYNRIRFTTCVYAEIWVIVVVTRGPRRWKE